MQKDSVNLNYQMPRGKVNNSREDMTFVTAFEPGSNMKLQCFGPDGMTMKKEEGWLSTEYRKKQKRMNVSFNVKKDSSEPVRYITVICPLKDSADAPKISAKSNQRNMMRKDLRWKLRLMVRNRC